MTWEQGQTADKALKEGPFFLFCSRICKLSHCLAWKSRGARTKGKVRGALHLPWAAGLQRGAAKPNTPRAPSYVLSKP